MLDAWEELLTLSTMIPLVPPLAATPWVTLVGGHVPPRSIDMMQPTPAVPPDVVWLALLATLKKIRSVAPLRISVPGEHSSPLPLTKLRLPSEVEFMTPVEAKPMR